MVNIVLLKLRLYKRVIQLQKREILECADGRKNTRYSCYWSYLLSFITMMLTHLNTADIIVGQGHAFKTPGKVCLDVNGEWEVKIMIRNLIIVALVLVIVYDVSSEDALGYVQSTLDFLQELVYSVKESNKL